MQRNIFAIPFGIAALGYGLASSKLPKKSVVSSNDDNYSAFRPRTVSDFESSKPQTPILNNGSLRGSTQQITYNPNSKDPVDTESSLGDASVSYNPYSTAKRRRVKRNRSKRRHPYNF